MIKRYSKPFIASGILLLLLAASLATASVVMGPSFFVKVEVLDLGTETVTRADGSTYTQNFIKFKILECVSGNMHGMSKGEVFKTQLFRRNLGLFKKGDLLIVGVEIGSSMGPGGPVKFMLWSPIKDASGKLILESFNFPAN